ncbi:MAG: alpha/beta hydrolase, partial [Solirubrobacterales bacterium]|nr:alpha/beta hydrolase [Solirubrobacterales bacterium]
MLSAQAEVVLTAVEMAQAGRFAEIRDLFVPTLQPMLTAETLAAGWASELGRRGRVMSVGAPVAEPTGTGVVVVKVPVSCEHGGFAVIAPVTEEGHLAGLQLAPLDAALPTAPWEPPGYADPARFEESEMSLESGSRAVVGTLSLPRGATGVPAVVLLAGSGPLDRDETVGRNKPFKDIAWGLASRGIAVLRFDKVSFAHAAEVREAGEFTLSDEYLPQALAAIEQLRSHRSVDPARIFLLGHSLGGTVAPRVAAAEPSVAGLILLAGGAEPMHRAMVRQVRYLASLSPESEAASAPVIEALSEKARLVDSPALSASTPAGLLPFGAPGSYWLDVRDYDPVALAQTLGKPILILQGGRDYQVTVADDLARWEAGMTGRDRMTI